MKNLSLALILLLSTSSVAQRNATPAQKAKRPSPPGTAVCKFSDGNTVTTDYSRPSMRGRKIYGGLVPYDQVWRTGANEATTFVTTTNLQVGNANIPKGSYTIFTMPSMQTWKLIVSKKTGEWGIPYPGEQNDLARVDMRSTALPSPVEQFTISYDSHGDNCTMNLDWAETRESVEIKEVK